MGEVVRGSRSEKKTHEQFLNEIGNINPNIEIIEKYKGCKEKIEVKCLICGNVWRAAPSKLLIGRGCPKCGRKKAAEARRNSFDKVQKKLHEINPNIEITGEYVSVDNPIDCKCLKCGFIWKPTLSNLYAGKGCPKCSGRYQRTHEEFVNELHDISPNIEVISTFINTSTKVRCRCLECGYIWESVPSSLLRGTGCRNCAVNRNTGTNRVHDDVRVFIYSPETFIDEIYKDNKNSTITLLDKYVNSTTKIKCKCELCGYEWLAIPYVLKKGTGCPQCNQRRKTDDYFRKQVRDNGFEIDILGEYKGAHSKIKCRCQNCGYIFEATAHSILQGHGCPECSRKKLGDIKRKTQDQFVGELAKTQPDILVTGKYKGNNTPVKCKCLNCKYIWSPRPADLLTGKGCPECNGRNGTSFTEQLISLAFENALGANKVFNRDRNAIGMELDIYIPDLNLAIEPGSWYWHKDKSQRDNEKKRLCTDKGIRLITIYDSVDLDAGIQEGDDCYVYYHSLSESKYYPELKSLIVDLLEQYDLNCENLETNFDEMVISAKRRSRRRGTKKFIREMELVNPDIEILGEYQRVHEKIECKCRKCGYIWETPPSSLLSGSGCPKCNGGYKKTHQEFIEQISIINPNIEVIGEYTGDANKISCKCRICGNKWSPNASSLINR